MPHLVKLKQDKCYMKYSLPIRDTLFSMAWKKNNGDILMLESEKSLVLPIHYSVSPSNISINVAILAVLKNGHSEIWLYEES